MKKAFKIIGIVLGVIILSAVAFYFWLFIPGSTKEIEEFANRFQPDPSWQLEDEIIRPPVNACFNPGCNSVRRDWKADSITKDTMQQSLDRSGFNLQMTDDCDPMSGLSGSGSTICSAEGLVDGYNVELYAIASRDKPEGIRIIFRVEG